MLFSMKITLLKVRYVKRKKPRSLEVKLLMSDRRTFKFSVLLYPFVELGLGHGGHIDFDVNRDLSIAR